MEKETYNFLLTEINKYLEVSEIIQEINNDTVYSAKDFDYTITIKDDLDNTLESLQLQDLQRKIVFLIAKYQNGGTGVSTQFLVNNANESSTPGSISNSINKINNASQKFFHNEDFKLITKASRSHFLINGKKVKNRRSFTIDDFFDVFSSGINKVKFNEEPRAIASLTNDEKEKLLFGLFEQDIIEEDKLIGLYLSLNNSISSRNALGIFEKTRIRLKKLLIDKEVFELDMSELFSKSQDLADALNKSQSLVESWSDSKGIFPRNSIRSYYSCYIKTALDIIASEKVETYFEFDWVSPFWDYKFSNEDECIDIDDIIVSFTLLALSNYKTGSESALLQKAREKYRTAVKKLIHERFGPTDNNRQDIIDVIVFVQKAQMYESRLKEELPDEIVNIAMGAFQKIFGNKNEYFNEDNDHTVTK